MTVSVGSFLMSSLSFAALPWRPCLRLLLGTVVLGVGTVGETVVPAGVRAGVFV